MNKNLNTLTIDDGYTGRPLIDLGGCNDDYEIIFRHLEDHLLRHIEQADAMVGCVAWVTSKRILHALAKKDVSLLVQKEDFLRPDSDTQGSTTWKQQLRAAYDQVTNSWWRPCLRPGLGIVSELSVCCDGSIAGIRCIGQCNKKPITPKMHHKFLVFGRYASHDPEHTLKYTIEDTLEYAIEDAIESHIQWYSVWTGSYNFTANGTRSLENAVVLKDPRAATRYAQEWEQLLALSEPLNWCAEYVDPEWRIGS